MDQAEAQARVAGDKLGEDAELVGEALQFEMHVAGLEHLQTAPEFGRHAEVRPVDDLPHRPVGVPGDDLANAAKVRIFQMPVEDGAQVVAGDVGMADDAVGEPVFVGHALQPAGLTDMIWRVVMGLFVDRLDHVMVAEVGQQVVDQVVPAQQFILGAEDLGRGRRRQPRIVLHHPDVMVGVDDRAVIHRATFPACRT